MKHLYLTTAILLAATPALADITPAELWQSWQADFAKIGITLSAEPEQRAQVLVLHNLKLEADFGFIRFEETLAEMRLDALTDGTIAMDYSGPLGLNMIAEMANGPSQTLTSTGEMKNAKGLITGTIDDYTFTFSVREMTQNGTTTGAINGENLSQGTLQMSILDMTGQNHVVHRPAGTSITSEFTVGQMDNAQTINSGQRAESPETRQESRSVIQGYSGSSTVFFPTAAPNRQSGSLIPEGFLLEAGFTLNGTQTTQNTESPNFSMKMDIAEDESLYALKIDKTSAGIEVDSRGISATLASPQFGNAPLTLGFARLHAGLTLPLRPGPAPQPASLALRLGGLTLNDALWAMLDPAGSLSHAPADFVLETLATITLRLDWTDFAAAKSWQGPPAILHRITLQEFLVAFENARLSGTGAVDFSNDGPKPVPNGGVLDFSFEGVNALLDKLGTLPLVNPSVIVGAKGMLGMFTTSGNGPDSLTSRIEFSEGGHMRLNGQQMR